MPNVQPKVDITIRISSGQSTGLNDTFKKLPIKYAMPSVTKKGMIVTEIVLK